MELLADILEQVKGLSENQQKQVLDFIQSMRQSSNFDFDTWMEESEQLGEQIFAANNYQYFNLQKLLDETRK